MCGLTSTPWLSLPATELEEVRGVRAHTLPWLAQRTVSRTKRVALNCSTQEVDHDPASLVWEYRTMCGEEYSDRSGHTSWIKVVIPPQGREALNGLARKDAHVQVNCTCPAFLYWVSQWIAHNNGYLYDQPRPLVVPPQVRFRFKDGSSTKRSLLCKHLISAGRGFLRGSSL